MTTGGSIRLMGYLDVGWGWGGGLTVGISAWTVKGEVRGEVVEAGASVRARVSLAAWWGGGSA